MNVNTENIETLIKSSHNSQLFLNIYQFMNQVVGTDGVLFRDGQSQMSIIGYLFVPYQTQNSKRQYPLISIAPQKNNISIYVMVRSNGESLTTKYQHIFGKSNVGKSCIRIKTMNDHKYLGLEQLISDAMTIIEKK